MFKHLLVTILLGPLLLLQGKFVRRTIEVLPEPIGQRQGRIGGGKRLRLLIVGDSAAAGVGAATQDQALLGCLISALQDDYAVTYLMLANTGDSTLDCIRHLQSSPAQKFDAVLTSLGVNDVTSGCSENTFATRQAMLIELLQSKFEPQQIILSGLPPMSHFPALPQPLRWYLGAQAKRFNRELCALASQHNLDFIEFEFDGDLSVMASDGFHPGPKVYLQWARLAEEKIRACQH